MTRPALTLLLSLTACAAGAFGAPPEDPPPASPPAKEPTLDELLGLPPQPRPADAADAGPDRAAAELEGQLKPEEVSEAFEQAVGLMDQTAKRLENSKDTGLQTQRLQEEVIRKLDVLIDQAQQQQSSSRSKRRPKPDQNQANQQQQQTSQSTSQQQTNDPTQGGGPARQDGALNPAVAGGSAAWGNLPEHVRDALVQGLTDQFSSKWKSLTEKYYQRLADQPKTGSQNP